jgi:hypothetical protein
MDDVIVLPSPTGSVSAETLMHEMIHVHQRMHQAAYDAFYERAWRFRRVSLAIPRIDDDSAFPGLVSVTNPDCDTWSEPSRVWIREISIDGSRVDVVTDMVLLPGEATPSTVAFEVRNSMRTGRSWPVASLRGQFFGVASASHPNELFAYIASRGAPNAGPTFLRNPKQE